MTTSTVALPRPTRPGSGAVTGLAIAVASALAFSSSGPFVKPLLEGGWSLGAVLLVRMALASLLLSPALVRAMRRRRGLLRRHGLVIVSFGLTAVAGCQVFYFAALQRMPVAVALLIQYIAPVLLVVAVWVRTRRAPSKLVVIGSVVAMAGLVLVVDISGARFDLLGTLFALCAAVCAAAYFVIAARAGDELPPLALAAGGLITGTLVMAVLVATGVLPFAAPAITVHVLGLEVPGILPLLWVGGVATTLGYAFGVIAVPLIGSRVASFVGLSEVLFALGFAWLLLGETPSPVQFVGGAVLLAGVVLVRLDAGDPVERQTETASVPVVPSP
jgi:drug/metabolite transporter (DMT)-like permease